MSRALALCAVALLVTAGCLGTSLPAREPPDHPATLTDETAAGYANASETYRYYDEAREAGATDFRVSCDARVDARFGTTRVVPVTCTGGYALGGFDGGHADVFGSALYLVDGTGSRRLDHESVRTRGQYVDGGAAIRLYNLAAEPRTLRVRVSNGTTLAAGTVTLAPGEGLQWFLPVGSPNATLAVTADGRTVERRIVRSPGPAPGVATAVYAGPGGSLVAGRGPGRTD